MGNHSVNPTEPVRTIPLLYGELATWWPLLSSPQEYEHEASQYRSVLAEEGGGRIKNILELGSGGGNNASHLKHDFHLTLVDVSPGMLDVSRGLNPECEHRLGDMRTVRLGRFFDAVFIHDAIAYMTSIEDLTAAFVTAAAHLRDGGVLLVVPDDVKETFQSGISTGGHDDKRRGLRYLEWTWDPDPLDSTCITDFAYLLREGGNTRCLHDRHKFGLFTRSEWWSALSNAGFSVRTLALNLDEDKPELSEAFVGTLTTAVSRRDP